ncbi:MAG: aspartate/glutamate racemase family protein [Glaciecola sp.]|nr:aspartate/glutamate racemase family protein [Glaciecola sp.]MDG1816622.1 aspartate/glutamate racemase family protein [Glaciecola sp.]MDG2098414.1 aspartate/glutamate racemase family protein [Glaciecola sp.]
MKTIGLLGGMSWESTVSYYQAINQGVKAQLGGLHSAKICLHSVDFAEIAALQHSDDWDALAQILTTAAQSLEQAGADSLVICTNTMHKLAPHLQSQLSIPLLHIADATAEQLVSDGITKVGLLGTRYTMEQDFYTSRLTQGFGIEVVLPSADQRTVVHNVIYEELCVGEINDISRKIYQDIIDSLAAQGAQAVILGCTEIALLISAKDTDVPIYDTTAIHAQAAVNFALA